MANKNLTDAKNLKNDEFYTQYHDIEVEMNSYLEYDPNVFRGKTILLPCDDPESSNFTRFFAAKFEELGLKKLISTSYAPDSKKYKTTYIPSLFELEAPQFDNTKTTIKGKIFVLERDNSRDGRINIDDLEWKYLEGDGDFRSNEVSVLRNEADIIITNPPFSLFREFLAWIMEANKKFIIIGNMNCITYKEVFPLIKENKVWLGIPFPGGNAFFRPATQNEYAAGVYDEDTNLVKFRNCIWLTNIDHGRRHQPLSLMTMSDNLRYSKHKELRGKAGYDHYDNYDAIEVPYTDAIPSDYDGVMGVPISFLDKYCPEQFEIVNANDYRKTLDVPVKAHGLIKDKEASITTYKDSECKKKNFRTIWQFPTKRKERETNNLCTNLYQTYCSLPELTVGMSTDNANMQGYSSVSYLDMVARPIVQGIKLYRRVFIKKKI